MKYVLLFHLFFYFSTILSLNYRQNLPSFSFDLTEVAIASVLERPLFENEVFHVTLFLIGHNALSYKPQMPFLLINGSQDNLMKWNEVSKSWKKWPIPALNGIYSCRLRHTMPFPIKTFETQAKFLPSDTSTDPGFNRNIEILRCPFPITEFELNSITKRGRILVEIMRNNQTIFNYGLSLKTRQTGYGFGFKKSSRFDAWNRKHRSDKTSPLLTRSNPICYICSPIIRPLEPHRPDTSIPMLLEFIQHNIILGFEHQFLGLFLDWDSNYMIQLLRILRPFIKSNQISVSSMTLPGYDDASGVLGMMFIDDFTRYIHEQQCLYLSKGHADYVALFHASEFLTFSSSSSVQTIQQLIHWTSIQPNYSLPCYYVFESFGIPDPSGRNGRGPESVWIHEYFQGSQPIGPLPAWITLLIPVQHMWMAAWHVGACCGLLQDIHNATEDNIAINYIRNRDISTTVIQKSPDIQYIPVNIAVMYFYRGHFDKWQLVRKTTELNRHLENYALPTAKQLEVLGYSPKEIDFKNLQRYKGSEYEELPTGIAALKKEKWLECHADCQFMQQVIEKYVISS